MTNNIPNEVWAFDCEWVPDIQAGKLLYHLPEESTTEEILERMWREGGATEENPQPFLRMIYCRLVSIVTVIRRTRDDGSVSLFLSTLPENPDDPEKLSEEYILTRFLKDGVQKKNPQLVGFNSRNADIRILMQRAVAKGLFLPSFFRLLDQKPWESKNIDLMDIVSGHGKTYAVSLNDISTLSGIPGKMDVKGDDVWKLWYEEHNPRKIVEYNCYDSLTTYLVWLRYAYISGKLLREETLEKIREEFLAEQGKIWDSLSKMEQAPGLKEIYTREEGRIWDSLKMRTERRELPEKERNGFVDEEGRLFDRFSGDGAERKTSTGDSTEQERTRFLECQLSLWKRVEAALHKEAYIVEQRRLKEMMEQKIGESAENWGFLQAYLDYWKDLQEKTGQEGVF